MKRALSFLLSVMLPIAACSGGVDDPQTPEQPNTPPAPENPGGDNPGTEPDTPSPGESGRYLVLYASRTNNTEHVAKLIQTTLGCDIIEVEPETPYDSDYNSMLERSQKELADIRQGNYPSVKTSVESFDSYSMIFVGYPIWYGSMATPMQTFLHENAGKLTGKRIALFATSGSSGISASVTEAGKLCPGAEIIDPSLLLTSSALSQAETRVPSWLESIGAKK